MSRQFQFHQKGRHLVLEFAYDTTSEADRLAAHGEVEKVLRPVLRGIHHERQRGITYGVQNEGGQVVAWVLPDPVPGEPSQRFRAAQLAQIRQAFLEAKTADNHPVFTERGPPIVEPEAKRFVTEADLLKNR